MSIVVNRIAICISLSIELLSSNYVGKKRRNLNVIYARVSTNKQKADLARRLSTLENFCLAQGIQIDQVFSDIASGINFKKR